jgi:hypothetical protein
MVSYPISIALAPKMAQRNHISKHRKKHFPTFLRFLRWGKKALRKKEIADGRYFLRIVLKNRKKPFETLKNAFPGPVSLGFRDGTPLLCKRSRTEARPVRGTSPSETL